MSALEPTPLEDAIARTMPKLHIIIERDTLLAAMSRLTGVLDRKGVVPIFGHVLIKAGDGPVTLRARSSDMGASVSISAEVRTGGEITVPGQQLRDIANAAPAGSQVSIQAGEDDQRAVVKCGKSRWKLPTMPAELMPDWPNSEGVTFTVNARTLSSAMTRTVFAVAKDSAKGAMLQGVYAHTKSGCLVTVATNSHRMSIIRTECEGELDPGCIMDARFVNECIRALDGEGDAILTLAKGRSRLDYGGFRLDAKAIDGDYPAYERAIPSHKDATHVSRADMLAAVKRVLAVASGERSVKLTMGDGGMIVEGRSSDTGEARDEIECERIGKTLIIALNTGYLSEALGNLSGDTITVETGTEKQSIVIREDDMVQGIGTQAV